MDNVIQFNSREKILERARRYVDDKEVFLDEMEQAVPLLLKALDFGEETLKSEIIFLLGSFAKEEAVWPFWKQRVWIAKAVYRKRELLPKAGQK